MYVVGFICFNTRLAFGAVILHFQCSIVYVARCLPLLNALKSCKCRMYCRIKCKMYTAHCSMCKSVLSIVQCAPHICQLTMYVLYCSCIFLLRLYIFFVRVRFFLSSSSPFFPSFRGICFSHCAMSLKLTEPVIEQNVLDKINEKVST